MERRKFSREFKLEAVKLVRERGAWRGPRAILICM
jgi:transposase-like protein